MIELLAALRAAVAELLEASGDSKLAQLVAGGEVAMAAPGEVWSMGSRTVTAVRVSLALSAPAYVELASAQGRFEAVKRAFAQAVGSPETELAELHLELKLPAIERSFRQAYRLAPPAWPSRERPAPEAILAGAAALLDALGERAAAAIVRRAELDVAPARGTSTPLLRCVARLTPADLAAAQRDARLGDEVRRAIQSAATRAEEEAVAELALALGRLDGA